MGLVKKYTIYFYSKSILYKIIFKKISEALSLVWVCLPVRMVSILISSYTFFGSSLK